jgi:hypothetical protein
MTTETLHADSTVAEATAATKKRTQLLARDFNSGSFDGIIELTPADDSIKSMPATRFDLSRITGFATMPKSARGILSRAVADQLVNCFTAVVKPSKDEPAGGTLTEALDEMSDCFNSIMDDTFTFGRSGSGATSGKVQGVPLTVAILVAMQYGLATRAEAMAHPTYPLLLAKVQPMRTEADTLDAQADAIAESNPDEAKVLTMRATALRSAYNQLAQSPGVRAIRDTWYPPKAKPTVDTSEAISNLFAGL